MLFLFNKSSIIILFLCFSFSWKKQLLIYFWIRRLLFYVLCVFFFAVYSFSFPIVLFWFTFSVPYIHVYGEKAVSKTGRRESTSIQIHERDKEDIIISKEGKNEGGDGTIIIILKRRDGDVIFHLERVGKSWTSSGGREIPSPKGGGGRTDWYYFPSLHLWMMGFFLPKEKLSELCTLFNSIHHSNPIE